MKIKSQEIAKVELTQMERNILATSCEILSRLEMAFTDNSHADLISVETGEVISLDDIPKVVGILDGIKYNTYWEVK